MNVAGWDVVRELANEGDVRRYEVTHADGRRGILTIAVAGSAFQPATGALDRGVDPFGNPYAVHALPSAAPVTAPVAAPANVTPLPKRVSTQTWQTVATLGVVAALGGGIALYLMRAKQAKSAERSLRNFAQLAVGRVDGRIHCLHHAGLCDSGNLSSFHLVDRTEVTWGEWKKCTDVGACPSLSTSGAFDEPVTNVSWDQAKTYCRWKAGSLPDADAWEAITRSAEARRYPWGDDAPTCERANTQGCDGKPTSAKRPNGASAGGVEDLSGNVAEWVATRDDRFEQEPSKTRTARGGSFARPPSEATAMHVRVVEGGAAQPDIGFRCWYDNMSADMSKYDEAERIGDLVDARIAKQPPLARTKPKFSITARVTGEKRGETNYAERVTQILTKAGLEAAPGGLALDMTCRETAYGEYSYSPSPYAGGGMPGTKVECELSIATCTTIKVEGSTGGTSTGSLYGDAVDDLLDSEAMKGLGVLVALCAGDETARPEVARVGRIIAEKFLGDGTGYAKVALARADGLPVEQRAEAFVANRDPVSAAKLGDAAMPALRAWAKTRNPRFGGDDLKFGAELVTVGPVGQRTVAALIDQLPPGEYESETEMITPWLELASTGSAPELAAAMARFEKAQDPKLVAAAKKAIEKIGAPK